MSLLDEIKQQLGSKKTSVWRGQSAAKGDPKALTLGTRIKAAMPSTPKGNVEDRRANKPLELIYNRFGQKMERQPGSYRQMPGYPSQIQPPKGVTLPPLDDTAGDFVRVPMNRRRRK